MKIKKIILTGFFLGIVSLSLYMSYTITLNNLPDSIVHLIANKFDLNNKLDYKIDFVNIYIKVLKNNHPHFKARLKLETVPVNNILYNTSEPIIYIYNTHSNEEYSYTKNDVYNIVPNVQTASYILESELKKLGINSIVESKNTIDIVNKNNMAYSESYKVSRTLLENKKQEYKSLIYFIDLHRDSVKRNVTTTEINGIKYARLMFLLGLENPNYQENKKFMTELNNYLNENYKGLSRGIYEKKGPGVDGVYNQDFDANTILIEVGGVDNTIEEVANSLKIVANCIYNYLNYHKTTN